MIRAACVLALFCGCSTSETPAWALDSIHLEPNEVGDARGFQTWSLYADGWNRRPAARHYICSVVITLEATGLAPTCSDCDRGWAVTTSLLETDCQASVAADPRFTQAQRAASPEDRAAT